MKILVTGGAGFIGGNFLRIMVPLHPEDIFVCFDALTYAGHRATIAGLEDYPNFRFVQGDIRDGEAVDALFAQEHFDAVVHFAAETHVDRSQKDANPFWETNYRGTCVLLSAAYLHGVKRFHHISTDEVYGGQFLDEDDRPCDEGAVLHPTNPYAASKAASDLAVLSYGQAGNIAVTISRCTNNYGPYQHPEKLIPLCFSLAKQDKEIPIYGQGLNRRDWIYVEDHCRAIDKILRQGKSGEIYNISGHASLTNLEVVQRILGLLGKPLDRIAFVADRPNHDGKYVIADRKIESELGFVPSVAFEEGLEKTIRWYLDHEGWLQSIWEEEEYRSWMKDHYR